MADEILTVDIQGLAELQKRLLEVPAIMNKKALKAGVYAAAKVIRDEARKNAPKFTPTEDSPIGKDHPPPGTLKRSIIFRSIEEASDSFRRVFKVTVRKGTRKMRGGKQTNKYDAYYAHLVEHEYGNSRSRAKPFLRPAFEAKKNEAVDAFIARLQKFFKDEYGW